MHSDISFSISDKALSGIDVTTGMQMLRDHGFSHIHFSYKWMSHEAVDERDLEQLQTALDNTGMSVLDVHGPHPGALDFAAENPEDRKIALERFRHRLKITQALGGDAMVYHVPTREFNETTLERYIDSLARLEDEGRACGVVIALENHYRPEIDKLAFPLCFEKFDSDYIGFTFDPGHASISGNFEWLLDNCMDRLTILHLNDNDGKSDRHWNPFQAGGVVDWSALARAIAQSNYRKPLQLEVTWREDKHPTREAFLADAAASARRLQDEIAALRMPAMPHKTP